MILLKPSSQLDYSSHYNLEFCLHFDTEVTLKHKNLSCQARILSCSLMKIFKLNSGVFLRQQYCNLFLVQYLWEISHEDTVNKLVDCPSVELAFQKLVCRLGGLQVWFSVVMELDSPRLKFRLLFMSDLAEEMQSFNLKLDKQKYKSVSLYAIL